MRSTMMSDEIQKSLEEVSSFPLSIPEDAAAEFYGLEGLDTETQGSEAPKFASVLQVGFETAESLADLEQRYTVTLRCLGGPPSRFERLRRP